MLLINPFAFYVIYINRNKDIDECGEVKIVFFIYRFISIVFGTKNKGKYLVWFTKHYLSENLNPPLVRTNKIAGFRDAFPKHFTNFDK